METKEEIIDNIGNQILKLEEKHNLSFNQILTLLKKRKLDYSSKTIPISIFNNKKLSALEAIVKYLKENLELNYAEIASLLNRNYDPIAVTYRNSKKKMLENLDATSPQKIPLGIFRNLRISVLENIALYLKLQMGLNYHQIALLMNRNDRTIWTVYQRALKKQK